MGEFKKMPLTCVMRCGNIIFDVYNTERVPLGISKNKYYVTPESAQDIRFWMWNNNVEKVSSEKHMRELIELGYIRNYVD